MAKSPRSSVVPVGARQPAGVRTDHALKREASKPSPKPMEDVALVCGQTADGKGLHILRKRHQRIEAGVVQPLEEGKPIHGELVTLKPRGQSPVCDVEVHYTAGSTLGEQADLPGPAQVANESYRKNWDTIWKSKPKSNKDKPLLN